IFQKGGVDEFRIFGTRNPHERPDQPVINRLGKEEADDESNAKSEQRLDQARAQLDQMIHQRRSAGLDVILIAHDALTSRPASCGTAGSGSGAGVPDIAACSGVASAVTGVVVSAGASDGDASVAGAGFSVSGIVSAEFTSLWSEVMRSPLANPVAASRT